MDFHSRRITRAAAGVSQENKDVLQGAPGKDILKPTRRAFADARNTRVVADKLMLKKVEPVKVERRVIPIIHPEVTGLERELSAVDFTDDVHKYLLFKEAGFIPERDFMVGKTVTPKMRSILIDWLVQVHGRFHLFPETLHLTIYIIDCAITQMKVDRSELQLVGIASMMVASKFEEMYVPDINDFEFICDNAFSRRQILRMELKVLQASGMQLSRPHSITFLRWLSKELKLCSTQRQHAMAKYFGEIALLDFSMVHVLPSQIAAISIFMACRVTGAEIDAKQMADMIGCSVDQLQAGVHLLSQATVKLHSQEKLMALQAKFGNAKHYGVANFKDEEMLILQNL